MPEFQPVEELQTDGTDLTNNTPRGQTTTTTTRNLLYTERQMRNNNAQNISLSLLHFRTLRRINAPRLLWVHIWLTGCEREGIIIPRENVEDNCEWRSLNWIASSVYLNDNHLIVGSEAWIELQQPLKSSTRTGDTRHTEVENKHKAERDDNLRQSDCWQTVLTVNCLLVVNCRLTELNWNGTAVNHEPQKRATAQSWRVKLNPDGFSVDSIPGRDTGHEACGTRHEACNALQTTQQTHPVNCCVCGFVCEHLCVGCMCLHISKTRVHNHSFLLSFFLGGCCESARCTDKNGRVDDYKDSR